MQRSLLLLALATAFVGCKSTRAPRSGAPAVAAPTAQTTSFSWQKDTLAPAAADGAHTTVRSLRADLALIELSAIEKRDPGARLQLTKGGKNFLVEIIKADDNSAVVAIVAGQAFIPEVQVGDLLGLAVVAQ